MKTTPSASDGVTELKPGVWRCRVGAEVGPTRLAVCVHGTGGNGHEELSTHRDHADQAFRAEGQAAVLLAPTFEVPYHFLLPDLPRGFIQTLQEVARAEGCEPRARLWGFSGGAQFAHRFALQNPAWVERVVALASGEWTAPDGHHHGMMTRTDWFERPPFAGHAGLREAAAVPAAPDWQHIRWLIGCGQRDTADRLETAAWFVEQLNQHDPVGEVRTLWYDGDHGHTPARAYRQSWDFLAEP